MYPKHVTICDCTARDGLQHETAFIDTDKKIELVERIADLGFKRVEITSFSHPKHVPQFADAEQVLAGVRKQPDVYYKATCVNGKAVERAMAARAAGHGPNEISLVVSVSEAHSLKNTGKTHKAIAEEFSQMIAQAAEAGFRIVGTLGTAFGCPFTGPVTDEQLAEWTRFFVSHGITFLCLGDTTGMANPLLVERRCATLREQFPEVTWIGHFHDTRGCGLANAVAALRAGVDHLDAAFGGLGGHPPGIRYGQGHTGNIATEDVVAMLAQMGIETGIDLTRLVETAKYVESVIGRELQGRVTRSGLVTDLLSVS